MTKIKALSKNQKRVIIFGEFAFICILGLILFYIITMRNWDAQTIVRKIISYDPALNLTQFDSSQTQEFSPEGMTSTAYFGDPLIGIDTNHPFAGCVEVYENHQYALLRKAYLEELNKQREEVFSQKDFGKTIANEYSKLKEELYVNGNVLIRLDSAYTTYQKDKITKIFNFVLLEDKQTEKNVPTQDALKKLKDDNKNKATDSIKKAREEKVKEIESEIKQLEEQMATDDIDTLLSIIDKTNNYTSIPIVSQAATELATKANDIITGFVTEVDDLLNQAENEMSRDILATAQSKIEALKHEIFTPYKEPWDSRITQIKWEITEYEIKLYKESCVYYEYDTVMANPDEYIGYRAYFRGSVVEVQQTNGSTVLRVNVTPIYSYFTDTILYWNDSIYVDLAGDISLAVSENDLVEMWGTIEGTTTHNTFFGGEQTVLRFSCQYIN